MAFNPTLPQVYLRNGNNYIELQVRDITTHWDSRGQQEIHIEGFLNESILREDPSRLLTAHPVNLGGIPSTIALRCPSCLHLDLEATHECSGSPSS